MNPTSERQAVRRFGVLIALLLVVIIGGTVAFSIVEGVSLGFGLIWTIDTISTVGIVPEPHNAGGRVIISVLELLGIGTLFYGLATVAEFFVSGQLNGLLEARRIRNMIDSYSDHYIVCGYGRVGRQVARDLIAQRARVVAIDEDAGHREIAMSDGAAWLEGTPTEDSILQGAGIERAAAVVTCVDSDADNIFVALSARELRPDILIVARASAEDSEKKLMRAGADRVVSPYKTTGSEMARIALHPQIGGAVEIADFRVEEIAVPVACVGVGQTVGAVRGRAVIVALRRADGVLEAQPSPQATIGAGDHVIALGTPAALEALEELFQPA